MKKKNEKVKLYKKFKIEQEIQNQEQNVPVKGAKEKLAEQREQRKLVKKKEREERALEKKRAADRRKEVTIHFDGKLVVSICSLTNISTGCTHMADTIAKYFIDHKKSVCIVNLRDSVTERKKICQEYVSQEEMIMSNENYEVIILNIGNIEGDNKNHYEIQMASKKVMMCLDKETYLMKLAEFVRENSEIWTYVFNFVPESKYKRIDALMEDYKYICLPLYQVGDKVTNTIIKRLFS